MLYNDLESVFRSLWTWVSMKPGRKKSDWPDWCIARDMVLMAAGLNFLASLSYCPACAEALRAQRLADDRDRQPLCSHCPVQWDGVPPDSPGVPCSLPGSAFAVWCVLSELKEGGPVLKRHEQALAYKIANMKWR